MPYAYVTLKLIYSHVEVVLISLGILKLSNNNAILCFVSHFLR